MEIITLLVFAWFMWPKHKPPARMPEPAAVTLERARRKRNDAVQYRLGWRDAALARGLRKHYHEQYSRPDRMRVILGEREARHAGGRDRNGLNRIIRDHKLKGRLKSVKYL